jgi:CheY-like chemotaxis protein
MSVAMAKTVLVVDDDVIDAYAVRRVAKSLRLAAEVEHVENGEEGLARLARPGPLPCCVLLDLNMPRMGGIAFLRAMRSDPRLRRIPVYIVTTSTRREELEQCKRSGANGYVPKSTELELFTTRITAVLRKACG